jgi:D-alanyl-D-alanine carboxypeptidase/D-alanyl-D-alanine-endopeptidase (penicillin-binding protein 4)
VPDRRSRIEAGHACLSAIIFAAVVCLLPGLARAEPPLQQAAIRTVGADQGVYAVAADGTVLAALNETRAVHPASVSKVATTLALLDRLGPDYRFETRLVSTGPISRQVIEGDLLLESQGDPFFIFESAFLILGELHHVGVARVQGVLRVTGPFIFNWQPDPAGKRLQGALTGREGLDAWPAVAARRSELQGLRLQTAALTFQGGNSSTEPRQRPLVTYRSPPLLAIMKALNSYSNNVFHPLSGTIGGPQTVERVARDRVPSEQRGEITIENGAGAGLTNRMSPRAAVSLVRALEQEAQEHRLRLTDLLPVAGVDKGTLLERVLDDEPRGALVGKTGTYGEIGISALAGVIRTKTYGEITFAVFNTGLPVPTARTRQDAFVHEVMAAGTAVPFPYQAGPLPLDQIQVDAVR